MSLHELANDLATLLGTAGDVEQRSELIKTWLLANKFDVLEMYEDENKPLVVNPAAPGDLKLGDYVFASRWQDCDPTDAWAVGHVKEIGPGYVVVGDGTPRTYAHAMRVSEEQGRRIQKEYGVLKAYKAKPSYEQIAKIFGIVPST